MRILHVIHGYPPFYMAGSEVYTYNITNELSKYEDINIFTRIENPFKRLYHEFNETMGKMKIRRINKPQRDYTLKDKYIDERIDLAFENYAKEIRPDIIHIGHLSHLSTNIVKIAKEKLGLPVIFTIHDFWLYCFRGQMIDHNLNLCQSPSDESCLKCAKFLFKEYADLEEIKKYRNHMKEVIESIDYFLSPSMFLKRFFESHGVASNRVIHSKYGFNKENIEFRHRSFDKKSAITFGFMGRIIPVKGIKLLLEVFGELESDNARLLIFGEAGPYTKYLESDIGNNVKFKGGYNNWEINKVLNEIDVLVVPSLWYENSPLVIQEAFLAGIPIVTANLGGMLELVDNDVDGFTFEVGNKDSLKHVLWKISNDPTILNELKPDRNKARAIEDDASHIRSIYNEVLKK